MYPTLLLRRGQDRRLRQGHLWIYSNEIDTTQTPLKSLQPGELVVIKNASGESLGIAYVNPNCLICARLLTRNFQQKIAVDFFEDRLQAAQRLRARFYPQPFYRLVFGESDGLPGVVIDRFADTFVVQLNTAGADRLQDLILTALQNVFKPQRIVLRNDSNYRATEGLNSYEKIITGDSSEPLHIQENNASFEAPLLTGQKTGWFYDHRDNRAELIKYVAGKSVLDVFSYLGAWGIAAACAGAQKVMCIDSSKTACEMINKNAALNKVNDRTIAICNDAFDALTQLIAEKQSFDIVILDPPAFIKSNKDKPTGLQAYKKLNRLGLQLTRPNGLLVSASCSMHLSGTELLEALQHGCVKTGREARVVAQWKQAKDHPVHPAIKETQYLKALFCNPV